MILKYPKDFTSTLTYQNSNFTFPHASALSLKPDILINHFCDPDYILPSYIQYGQCRDVMSYLNDERFNTLGVGFIKLKSLEEQFDYLFKQALEWKSHHTHGKYNTEMNTYITPHYYNLILVIVSELTTLIQLMIINVIDEVDQHDKLPSWLNHPLIQTLHEFNQLLMIDIPVSITVYLAKIIPLLIKMSEQNDFIIQ